MGKKESPDICVCRSCLDQTNMKGAALDTVTLFTTCKPFRGTAETAQRNALFSWKELGARVVIIGDDAGAKEAAEEFGAVFVPGVDRNESGTPLVSSVFEKAAKAADTAYLAYLNADIILTRSFVDSLTCVLPSWESERPLLMTSRRRNLPLFSPLDDDASIWRDRLAAIDESMGSWDQANAIDLFVFNRGLFAGIPGFAIGRMNWDNWLLWRARENGAAVVDASQKMALYHPIHGYTAHADGWRQIAFGAEAVANRQLAHGRGLDLDQATTHFLSSDGTLRVATEQERQHLRLACKPDPQQEFQAGLAYLADYPAAHALEDMLDFIRTLLWRNQAYFPIWACPDLDITAVHQTIEQARCLLASKTFAEALDLVQDLLTSKLIHTLRHKSGNIYVWGAGQAGFRALRLLKRHGITASGIIDSDPEKTGTRLAGCEVFGPEKIAEADKNNIQILIASMHAPEIIASLEKAGVDVEAAVLA